MTVQDIYLKAMEASIQNAEQWVKDAFTLLKHKSFTHARALQNFASEECAKAIGCWLVGNGLIPLDHAAVRIEGNKGIFKSHNLKNKLSLLLGSLSILPEITPSAAIGILIVAEATAKLGTEKRMEWMYVDIIQSNDEYYVSNPLEIDTGDVVVGLNLVLHEIQFLRRTINETDEKTLSVLKDHIQKLFTDEG